jgi:3,4-dihydroxy 2-butanone 4-phosphate synthase / GTP cyclohydrolase II
MEKAADVRRVVSTALETAHGTYQAHGYLSVAGYEHLALTMGHVAAASMSGQVPLVRVHSECLTGDALTSLHCDCGDQLQAALIEIARHGCGVLIYLRGHEGRGIGLTAKLQAYALQRGGLDTVDANLELGLPVDARDYAVAAAMLLDLGVPRVRLLSGNGTKGEQLRAAGIDVVSRHPLRIAERPENAFYLRTKRLRLGHDDADSMPDVWGDLVRGRVPDRTAAGRDLVLLDRYAPLVEAGATLTIAQLAQSADGFIASRTGDAEFVSGVEDREHLHRLRALVDAVVVGASTVTCDDPRLTTRAVAGSSPVRVVLDPTARIPRSAQVLCDDSTATLWCVNADAEPTERLAPHVRVVPVTPGSDGFQPSAVLKVLRDAGLGRVLVEGGGRTVSRFFAAGALDRLYLTTAPLLIGDGVPGLRFTGANRLAEAVRVPTQRFVLGHDVCTVFDLRPFPRSARQNQEVAVPDANLQGASG